MISQDKAYQSIVCSFTIVPVTITQWFSNPANAALNERFVSNSAVALNTESTGSTAGRSCKPSLYNEFGLRFLSRRPFWGLFSIVVEVL
jgi:hypothetical protein